LNCPVTPRAQRARRTARGALRPGPGRILAGRYVEGL